MSEKHESDQYFEYFTVQVPDELDSKLTNISTITTSDSSIVFAVKNPQEKNAYKTQLANGGTLKAKLANPRIRDVVVINYSGRMKDSINFASISNGFEYTEKGWVQVNNVGNFSLQQNT